MRIDPPPEKPLPPLEKQMWEVGDWVTKVGGDAEFEGIVVAAFMKLNQRSWRYVVEDSRGLLMIYSAKNLEETKL